VEPAAARDACAAISGGAASVAGKRNAENNPMHSSEAIGEMRFFRSGLTCRAKQEHGVIMPSFRDGEETPGLRCCAGIRSAPRGRPGPARPGAGLGTRGRRLNPLAPTIFPKYSQCCFGAAGLNLSARLHLVCNLCSWAVRLRKGSLNGPHL
jgi:hypothetical protein